MFYGVWLSLVKRCVRDAETAGSNPVTPTVSEQNSICSDFFIIVFNIFKGVRRVKMLAPYFYVPVLYSKI